MCELLHYFAGFPKKMQIDGWLREKGPALLAGPRGQSCSAGGWVVSRSRAHSQFGTVELVPDGRSPAVIPGEGGNGLAVPRVVIARGCAPHAQPPEWPPPRAEAKDKKVRAPPARASPNGPGGPQHRLPTVQNYFDIGNATQAGLSVRGISLAHHAQAPAVRFWGITLSGMTPDPPGSALCAAPARQWLAPWRVGRLRALPDLCRGILSGRLGR
jgi:hypothetical protein